MATVLIARNITSGPTVPVLLENLGVTVPPGGQVILTDVQLLPYEVFSDPELQAAVENNELVINDGMNDLPKSAVLNGGVPPVVFEAFEPDVTVTTSTKFLGKTKLSCNVEAGNYWIEWSYGWNHNSQKNDFESRLLLDEKQLGELHKEEPQDSAGSGSTGTSQRLYASRRYLVTLTRGEHTLVLEYRTDAPRTESGIWEASIIMREAN